MPAWMGNGGALNCTPGNPRIGMATLSGSTVTYRSRYRVAASDSFTHTVHYGEAGVTRRVTVNFRR